MKTLTQAAFANNLGVGRSYITQLKQAGRLVMSADGKRVKVSASLARIKETADPNRDDVQARYKEARSPEELVADPASGVKPKQKKERTHGEVTFSEGRAKEQHYKSLSAELEYKQRVGELVPMEDMKMAVADLVTSFRQQLENLPHRIAADLVAKDIDVIRATLKQEVHAALANLERGCNEKIQSAGQEVQA